MRRVLYFRLGESDRITFGVLLNLLSNVRHLLQDFDAAMSRDPRGSVLWEVSVLQKQSPVLLGLTGEVIRRRRPSAREAPPDFTDRVGREVLSSTAKISYSAERPSIVSDSAMLRYRNLAKSSRKIGDIAVYDDDTKVIINENTLSNIRKLTGPSTKSVGSILGRLESISVHRSNEIRVWDENYGRPIRCRYPIALEETVKAALRERVLVSGVVAYNATGQPISVQVRDIEQYPKTDELPSVEDVTGIIDLTGDGSLADYMSQLRED